MTVYKPLWLDGMFVQPHHFQLHDRYFEELLATRVGSVRPHGWGVLELDVDDGQLALGNFALKRCKAVMRDGAVIDLPGLDTGPAPLVVPPNSQGKRIMLALPRARDDAAEVVVDGEARFPTRFKKLDAPTLDTTTISGTTATLAAGAPNLMLVMEDAAESDFVTLAVAQVRDIAADGTVVLDNDFVPPLLDARASARFRALFDEVIGLLTTRAGVLAGRVRAPTSGAPVSSIADLISLQIVNRTQAVLVHLRAQPNVHPEVIFREFTGLAAELATFADRRRLEALAEYDHNDLRRSFESVVGQIREALSTVSEEAAVQLPIEQRRAGVYISPVTDRNLVASARYVLSVAAEISPEDIRTGFPRQVKIGPVEDIRELVTLQLPGVPLRPQPTVPRQIPYHAGSVYFELDNSVELWRKMSTSAAFGLHVSGTIPGLQLEFWAIRNAS